MSLRWGGLLFVLGSLAGCQAEGPWSGTSADGVLRVALAAEPQSWNRLLATDLATHVVTDQLHAPLIRLDPVTQQMEPALAHSWEFSENGTELTFHLRKDVRFSDGAPFTARDVAFTFRALHDPKVMSQLRDSATLAGKPLEPRIVDEHTVCFSLPVRTATVERIFDSIAILPEHRLKGSLEDGRLVADTGLGAAIESIVGLGPFVLDDYLPGERIVLARNPHYWKSGLGEGVFPRLSQLIFEILPDPAGRLLRFRAGQIDLLEPLSPEAFESLSRESREPIELLDLGPGMISERLWFNLNPSSPLPERKKRWFSQREFRRAVSLAIDREAIAEVVFQGRATPATGPVSPANRFWRNPSLGPARHDPPEARTLLSRAGFRWDAEGALVDGEGRAVRFGVVTRAGSTERLRMVAMVQEDLKRIGIEVHAVPLEAGGLLGRLTGSFDYDACLLGIGQTDPDPSAEMGLWMSKAPLHLWHPAQPTPATPWEARIDELMERQMVAVAREERRVLYHEVQALVAEHLPVLDLVVPHALVGVHRRVRHLKPTPFRHSLWNSDELSVGGAREKYHEGRTRDKGH